MPAKLPSLRCEALQNISALEGCLSWNLPISEGIPSDTTTRPHMPVCPASTGRDSTDRTIVVRKHSRISPLLPANRWLKTTRFEPMPFGRRSNGVDITLAKSRTRASKLCKGEAGIVHCRKLVWKPSGRARRRVMSVETESVVRAAILRWTVDCQSSAWMSGATANDYSCTIFPKHCAIRKKWVMKIAELWQRWWNMLALLLPASAHTFSPLDLMVTRGKRRAGLREARKVTFA